MIVEVLVWGKVETGRKNKIPEDCVTGDSQGSRVVRLGVRTRKPGLQKKRVL